MKTMSELASVIIIFILLVSAVVLLGFNHVLREENKKLQTEVDYFNSTYLTKQGGTMLNGKMQNYYLKSFDGGKIWYAVDHSDSGLRIMGDVETVYPKLLATINGWEALRKHVDDHGPIDPNKMTPELAQIMKDVGITIEKK